MSGRRLHSRSHRVTPTSGRSAMKTPSLIFAVMLSLVVSVDASAADFTYQPPGDLEETGKDGRVDDQVYVPNMRYPIENAPSYANSQVWGHGGYKGPGGGQCNDANYSYPWWDNFCETRSWDVPLCPGGNGHQGQDIRPATCEDAKHWAVAAESGTITNIGTYSMYLKADNGTRHRYLHMQRASYTVSEGDRVAKGDRLGKVSNEFGGTPTTIHLHYDLYQNVSGIGRHLRADLYVARRVLPETFARRAGRALRRARGEAGALIDDAGPCFHAARAPRLLALRDRSTPATAASCTGPTPGTTPDPGNWAEWDDRHSSEAGTYRVEVFLVSGLRAWPSAASTASGTTAVDHASAPRHEHRAPAGARSASSTSPPGAGQRVADLRQHRRVARPAAASSSPTPSGSPVSTSSPPRTPASPIPGRRTRAPQTPASRTRARPTTIPGRTRRIPGRPIRRMLRIPHRPTWAVGVLANKLRRARRARPPVGLRLSVSSRS